MRNAMARRRLVVASNVLMEQHRASLRAQAFARNHYLAYGTWPTSGGGGSRGDGESSAERRSSDKDKNKEKDCCK
jgi:hypothetical protein